MLSFCGLLPFVCDVCPTCNGGIKPTRSYQWINAKELLAEKECENPHCLHDPCYLTDLPERAGLIWIGGRYYKTPADWLKEVASMGVSRRIPAIPHDFELGKTIILVAHRKAVTEECPCEGADAECENCRGVGEYKRPAIFSAFRPIRIEYVVSGKETEEELERLSARGLTLVRVHRLDDSNGKNAPALDSAGASAL